MTEALIEILKALSGLLTGMAVVSITIGIKHYLTNQRNARKAIEELATTERKIIFNAMYNKLRGLQPGDHIPVQATLPTLPTTTPPQRPHSYVEAIFDSYNETEFTRAYLDCGTCNQTKDGYGLCGVHTIENIRKPVQSVELPVPAEEKPNTGYVWRTVVKPDNAPLPRIEHDREQRTDVWDLRQGTYVFQLSQLDKDGVWALKENVSVTVPSGVNRINISNTEPSEYTIDKAFARCKTRTDWSERCTCHTGIPDHGCPRLRRFGREAIAQFERELSSSRPVLTGPTTLTDRDWQRLRQADKDNMLYCRTLDSGVYVRLAPGVMWKWAAYELPEICYDCTTGALASTPHRHIDGRIFPASMPTERVLRAVAEDGTAVVERKLTPSFAAVETTYKQLGIPAPKPMHQCTGCSVDIRNVGVIHEPYCTWIAGLKNRSMIQPGTLSRGPG